MRDCITNASDCGFTLPTPTARDWKDTFGMGTVRPDGKSRLDRLPMLLFSLVRDAGISPNERPPGPENAKTVVVKDQVEAVKWLRRQPRTRLETPISK